MNRWPRARSRSRRGPRTGTRRTGIPGASWTAIRPLDPHRVPTGQARDPRLQDALSQCVVLVVTGFAPEASGSSTRFSADEVPTGSPMATNHVLGLRYGHNRTAGGAHPASGVHLAHLLVLDENKAVAFGSIGEGWHKHYLAMLGWGVLLAISLVLAALLQIVAATTLAVSEEMSRRSADLDDVPPPYGSKRSMPRPSRARCRPRTTKLAFPRTRLM